MRNSMMVVMLAAGLAGACEIRRDETALERPVASDAAPHDTVRQGTDQREDVTQIHVTLTEWLLTLNAESVDAGTISFSVTNTGQLEHALQIEPGFGQTDRLFPGESTYLELQLAPGTYYLSCAVEDEHGAHHELGERVTLVVR